ncbi:hypothetical protein HN681_03765 [archaeon]|jgi:hypothetical protein|nr:hypothetical protein [archaeon]MBT3730413.1 hypothetical protein [archaeon]MBT4670396.1 hypothetical protein [archaeon]MBT5030139.1 hypothetical protein [archaeon]MBT5288170.1 hypothetical protein [archaeon]
MNLKKFDVSIRRCIDKILKDESILDVKVENVVYHPIKGDDLYLWEIKCLRFDEGILNSKNIPLKKTSAYVYYSVERDAFDVYALGIKYDLDLSEVRNELFYYFSPDIYEKRFIKS